jgi:hypothetical protein
MLGVMALTPRQFDLLYSTGPVIYLPSGEQTPQQARNFAADSFRAACEFDGIGVPRVEDVLDEMDLRVGSARRLPRVELRSVRGP